MKHKSTIILLTSLMAAGSIQAEERISISKEVTGIAGLTPKEDLYNLRVFDNNFILPVYQTQSANQAYYAPQNPNNG